MELDMDDGWGRKGVRCLLDRWHRRAALRLSWPTRITLARILLIVPFVGCMLNAHDPQFSESG